MKDLSWFRPDGKEMTEDEWHNWFSRCVGPPARRGRHRGGWTRPGAPIVGDTFLLLDNAHYEPVPFVLPAHRARVRWEPGARHARRGTSIPAARAFAPAISTRSRGARSRCSGSGAPLGEGRG